MRSHRGNIPQLSQTKLCPFCPAKFTRTTHLNRHLRNNTDERLHRCGVCNAQFTRSNLLARHKRSCGESAGAAYHYNEHSCHQLRLCPFCAARDTRSCSSPSLSAFFFCGLGHFFFLTTLLGLCLILSLGSHPINRSRKRSCLACTSLKFKCDIRQPCSKCRAHGRDCLYVTEDGQGESTLGSSSFQQFPGAGFSGPIVSIDASAGFGPSLLGEAHQQTLRLLFLSFR
ncbi:hypothetical protein EDB89DRAFT_441133 [Lactarius sanguifluus]|nr:hypothetical protein EDB89DRAFT_441133 [Lactarius sanguifluus]